MSREYHDQNFGGFFFLQLFLIFWEWIFPIILKSSQSTVSSTLISILSVIILIALIVIGIFFTIAQISLFARRLHDVNKSGWWQLLPITIIGIIPLIYWLIKNVPHSAWSSSKRGARVGWFVSIWFSLNIFIIMLHIKTNLGVTKNVQGLPNCTY